MKIGLKWFVSILLIGALTSLLLALMDTSHRAKWLSSAGLIFDIAGISQLDIVGFMEKLLERYGDTDRFPYGPPSHITRRIIDNPDTPIRNWIAAKTFTEPKTGYYMLVVGFFLQLAGTWA
jgi:hypothetical protein